MSSTRSREAVFVVAGPATGQQGPVAAWMSTAGWAAAARRVVGAATIMTPFGAIEPEDARRRGSDTRLSSPASSWRRRVPAPLKTALKDARQASRARAFRIDPGRFAGRRIAFVWQRHELFQTAGVRLARALRVPSVLFVPATHVWEAEQWGVRRPGWKHAVERWGESPALRSADVVCCGTEVVAEQARRLGARPERILITPTGVDLDLFAAVADQHDAELRRDALGLSDRFVVGWVGSFRGFHALALAIDAVAGLENTSLLLVGDGPERAATEALARRRGVHAVFTGTVAHEDLPAHLAAMDVAIVVAARGDVFHYSPLKLAEYLAAGRPAVAPDVPQLAARLTDGVDAVLVPPGDTRALRAALRRLQADPAERARIGAAARASAFARWSWDHAVSEILAKLGDGSGAGRVA